MAHTFSRRVSDVRQRYRSDERGVVALMMAMAFVFVVSIVGGAIDYSRWLTASSKMQSTLDASVLAAARTFMVASETEAKATAQTYFEQNKHQHTSNASASFVIENGSTVRGTITGGIQTSFLRVIGIDELPLNLTTGVSMSGAADGKGGNLEMAVMLDITGSMCDDGSGPCASSTKLNALQEATRDLANIVIWEDQSVYTSKMALIPFSTRVRLAPNGDGGSIMQAMTELAPTWSGYVSRCVDWTITPGTSSETGGSFNCHSYATQYANNWKVRPCVTDRNGSHEHAETSPSLNAWMNAHGGNRSPVAHGSASTPQTTQLGVTETDPYVAWNYNEGGSCSDVAEGNQLLPLTANKSVVIDRINGLTAEGATAGALGTAMTWYTLSPEWKHLWPPESQPATYAQLTEETPEGGPMLRKVAVLMSDGVFNSHRAAKGVDQQTVSDHAKALCTAMKAKGVEIYTVGFMLNELPQGQRDIAEDTLRSCGSSLEHFYNTFEADQLKGAFRSIAIQIATIRITD